MYLPFVIIAFLVIVVLHLLGDKLGLNKRIAQWFRQQRFFHAKPFVQMRFYYKVLFPHSWSYNAYTRNGRKQYPVFYSVLNFIQLIFLGGSLLLVAHAYLSYIKISEVKSGHFQQVEGQLLSVVEPRMAQNGKYYRARLSVLLPSGRQLGFSLNYSFFENKKLTLKPLETFIGQRVEIRYFNVMNGLGGQYLLSLQTPDGASVISFNQAINAYQSNEFSSGLRSWIKWFFVLGVIAAIWKYKRYGFRNYFQRIKPNYQPNKQQKAEALRDEAYRVAFFSDEHLSQEMLEHPEQLKAYIARNKK